MKELNYKIYISSETWNKTVFCNVHAKVKEAEQRLIGIQNDIDTLGYNDFLFDQQKAAQIELEFALNMEEDFWREKSTVTWHSDGDRNTRYFHRLSKIKNTFKLINSIKDGEDMITDPKIISSHFTNHFKNIFSTNIIVHDLQVQDLLEGTIQTMINDEMNQLLTKLPNQLEIHKVMLDMNKDGAPGPDGFGVIFYQTFWDIIKIDVTNTVLEFFKRDWILPNFNANTIVLIPKVPDALNVGQYRPIALANFKFKIISKLLADRLAPLMKSIISPEQRGFIQGRNIRDCICVTSEAINHLHHKAFAGNLTFKVDISKAFDTL